MMRSLFLIASLLLAGFSLPFSNAAMAAGTTGELKAFVQHMGDETLAIVKNDKLTEATKEQKLTALFVKTIDMDWVSKFVLGRYWRQATPAQRKQYTSLYQKFLIASYVPRFREYNNERFDIINVRPDTADEYLVQTEIIRPGQPSVLVDYRVRARGKDYKVFDVIVEGVSMLSAQRSEFASVIQRQGFDNFLTRLESRIAALKEAAAAKK